MNAPQVARSIISCCTLLAGSVPVALAQTAPQHIAHLKEMQAENAKLQSRISALQSELSGVAAREQIAKAQIVELKAQLTAARTMSSDVEQLSQRLTQYVAETSAEMQSLAGEIDALTLEGTAAKRALHWTIARSLHKARTARRARKLLSGRSLALKSETSQNADRSAANAAAASQAEATRTRHALRVSILRSMQKARRIRRMQQELAALQQRLTAAAPAPRTERPEKSQQGTDSQIAADAKKSSPSRRSKTRAAKANRKKSGTTSDGTFFFD